MSPGDVVRLVTGREVRERLRSRALQVSTALSVALIAAVVLVAGAVADDDDRPRYEVGTLGERPAEVVAVAADLAGAGADLDATAVPDEAEARRRLADGDLDAVVTDDRVLVADGEPDDLLAGLLQAGHREVALAGVLAEIGATPEQVAAAAPEPLDTSAVDPDDATDDRRALATVGSMLLYGQLLFFGYWVASGIVEEKSSRVIELLLAKAGARALLAGKVLGIGVVGLGQLVVFVATGLGLATATGAVDLPPGTAGAAVALVAWFLAGYALYACLFAMAGAIASRAEELQATTTPITLVVMVGFFAALGSAQEPDGTVARVASLLPITSPLVMPIRMAAGVASVAEVVLAAVLVVAAIAVVVRIATRVYAGGALSTRGRLGLREALARSAA